MRKIELLVPASSLEVLKIAVILSLIHIYYCSRASGSKSAGAVPSGAGI